MRIVKNEAELSKLGLMIDPNDPTKAVPLAKIIEEIPDESWSLDRLAAYVSGKLGESKDFETQARVIARKSTLVVFRAGRALCIARKKAKEQKIKWTVWLEERNIPRTNDFEARELFKRAKTEEAVAGLTLTQAKKKFCIPKSPRERPNTPLETPKRTSPETPASSNRRMAPKDNGETPELRVRHPGEDSVHAKGNSRIPNTPLPPPKENPDLPLTVLVKVKIRLTYLEDEIKQADWTKESPKDCRDALVAIIKTARQIAKEIPNER